MSIKTSVQAMDNLNVIIRHDKKKNHERSEILENSIQIMFLRIIEKYSHDILGKAVCRSLLDIGLYFCHSISL